MGVNQYMTNVCLVMKKFGNFKEKGAAPAEASPANISRYNEMMGQILKGFSL